MKRIVILPALSRPDTDPSQVKRSCFRQSLKVPLAFASTCLNMSCHRTLVPYQRNDRSTNIRQITTDCSIVIPRFDSTTATSFQASLSTLLTAQVQSQISEVSGRSNEIQYRPTDIHGTKKIKFRHVQQRH